MNAHGGRLRLRRRYERLLSLALTGIGWVGVCLAMSELNDFCDRQMYRNDLSNSGWLGMAWWHWTHLTGALFYISGLAGIVTLGASTFLFVWELSASLNRLRERKRT
jgi:hypothetical protein